MRVQSCEQVETERYIFHASVADFHAFGVIDLACSSGGLT